MLSSVQHALKTFRLAIHRLKRMEVPSSATFEPIPSGKRKLDEEVNVLEKKLRKDSADSVAVESSSLTNEESKNLKGFQKRKRQKKTTSVHNQNSAVKHKADLFNEDETSYYFENGLRKVHPYFFTFHTFCKGRWLGKTLLDIYSTEFRYYPISHYENARKSGDLLLNRKPISSLNVVIKESDMLTSRLHRHEGSVTGEKIEILADDSKFLVVNKPSSIPIHPCGRYRNNTLTYILRKEYGYENLLGCYRLDRLTSGIVIFAKTKLIANKVITHIQERKVEKQYVCKVIGEFPVPEDSSNIVCNQPVTLVDRKLGLCAAWEIDGYKSKDASTEFKRISTDGETSVVLCTPKTGRTHQIRVHLQFLGFPIVNDPMYNHKAWGEERFREGACSKPVEDIAYEISRTYDCEPHGYLENAAEKKVTEKMGENTTSADMSSDKGSILDGSSVDEKEQLISIQALNKVKVNTKDPHYVESCVECNNPLPEPDSSWMKMYLHAFKYKGPDWGFQTSLPDWVDEKSFNKEEFGPL